MEESILGKSHMNVNCVASVLVKQEVLGKRCGRCFSHIGNQRNMKESILGKGLMNANGVRSVLRKQDT